jgi:hypothetical protein
MKVVAGAFRNPSFSRRSLLKGTLAAFAYSILGEHAFGATLPKYNVVLGRPTKSSIALSLIAGTSLTTYVEYGTSPKSLNKKTAPILIPALVPKVVELSGLQPNSNIYYRVRSKSSDAVNYDLGAIGNFSTQKKPGANFSFVVQGDSHPERAGKMFNADLYVQTLPQPSHPGNGTNSAIDYGYGAGKVIGGSGYLRVKTDSEKAQVDFVKYDGTIADSYRV